MLIICMAVQVIVMPISAADVPGGRKSADDTIRYTVLLLDTEQAFTMSHGGKVIYKVDTPLEIIKKAATRFVEQVRSASGTNYVAVVSYSSTIKVESDFTTDVDHLSATISDMKIGGNFADINSALKQADKLLSKVTDENAIKNIVLLTQGVAGEGEYSNYGKYSDDDCSWLRSDNEIYVYQYSNVAYDTASSIMNKYYVYSIGLFQRFDDVPAEGMNMLNFAKKFAYDIQNAGFYDVDDVDDLEFAFGEVADKITYTHGKFRFAASMAKVDGTEYDQAADYFYNDGYFFTDPTEYNTSLSTMSLCLELSTWSSYNHTNWYDPTLTEDDPEFWDDKLINVKTLLLGNKDFGIGYEGIGFHSFKANDFWNKTPEYDSIGVVAARKTISDGDDDYNLIALVVRGGGYGSEWASNFTLGLNGEHEGFAEARDNVLTFLKEYISDIPSSEPRKIKLWVVGYSRGGVTANMVAGALNDGYNIGDVSFTPLKDMYCYAFEPPMGSTKNQVEGDYSNIHNVVNPSDLVPLVAPEIWGFSRYNNANTYVLPNALTRSGFTSSGEYMLREFDKLGDVYGYGREDYGIKDIVTVKNLYIDHTKILPGGEKWIKFEESNSTTNAVMSKTLNYLFNNLFLSRANYYVQWQHTVRTLTGVFCHYYGWGVGLTEWIVSKSIYDDVIEHLSRLYDIDNIIYILEPQISFNPIYTLLPAQRMVDTTARFNEVVDFVGLTAKISAKLIEIGFDAVQTKLFVKEVERCLLKIGDDFLELCGRTVLGDTSDFNSFVQSFRMVMDLNGLQAHYPEICLAWLRSQDSNYNNMIPEKSSNCSDITRVIHINCPVDVNVYDSGGKLVASIIDDVVVEELSSIVCIINSNGEKLVYLPGDEDYRIDIIATDNGYVAYAVNEYNFVYGTETRILNYYDVPVTVGDILKGLVPKISEGELQANDPNGSTVDYKLLDKTSDALPVDTEYTGEQITDRYFNVTLQKEGNGGYVTGSGKFLEGNFAQVVAQKLPSAEFYGWYNGDDLVSSEMVYRFAVTENIVLTAKFGDVEVHELKLSTDEGGKVTSVGGYYSEGISVAVVAEANEGYVFDYWSTSNGGTFESVNDKYTFFEMPNNEVTVTAHFKVGTETDNDTTSDSIIFPNFYNVTVTASKGGKTNASDSFYIAYGASRTIKITPDDGYEIADVIVNGKSVGGVSSYSIKGACMDYDIEIRFAEFSD